MDAKSIEITTHVGCSVSCEYCPQDVFLRAYRRKWPSAETTLSYDSFAAICGKLPGPVDIRFAGFCEPWMNRRCTDMVLCAHDAGHKVVVYTTLVGMTQGDIVRMEHIPFKKFDVHVPGSDGREEIRVDGLYLGVLDRLLKSRIRCSFHCNGRPSPALPLARVPVNASPISTRAGNLNAVRNPDKGERVRLKGRLECRRIYQNVLLPNGAVALCCMDCGLDHVLGNLLTESYESIASSAELQKVKAGLCDDRQEVLCRYCDLFAKQYS